jgi:NSS family neurotransmitter:Na+ symporter
VLKVDVVIDEATKNGESFGRRGLYVAMIRYIAPLLLGILLLMSLGIL